MTNAQAGSPGMTVSRTFHAPREVVWRALTEPEHLARWWGPAGADMQVISLDLRPNGIFHYSQQADGGPAVYGRFVYREISAPEKLVFTTAFSNEQAQAVHAPISEDWPLEILNTLVLTESGGKTTLLLQGAPLTPTPAEAAMFASLAERIELGFASTLGQLDTHLKTMLKE